MKISRNFSTSLTIGAFLLMGVTGILMFFHFDTGFNKLAHEWTGLVMVIAVILHVITNFTGFKRYFKLWQGRALMGLFGVVLALSFVSLGGSGKPPYIVVVDELAARPISELAYLSGEEHLQQVLMKAGIEISSQEQTLVELTHGDFGDQMRLLEELLSTN